MAIHEYAVPVDFFQCDEHAIGDLDFPCCVCKYRNIDSRNNPCRVCGHNASAVEIWHCSICGKLQDTDPSESETIANGTDSQISSVCGKCHNTIKESFNGQ